MSESFNNQYYKEIEKNRAILESSVDAVISISQNGIVEFFNGSAEKLFGYKREEVIGKKVNMLMPEQFAVQHDTFISNYIKTGIDKVVGIGRELIAKHKSGLQIPVLMTLSKIQIDGAFIFTAFIKDLQTIKGLERNLEQYEKFFYLSDNMLCIIDSKTKIFKFNTAFTGLLDCNEEVLAEKDLLHFIHPYDKELFKNKLESLDKFKSIKIQCRFVSELDKIIWVAITLTKEKEGDYIHCVGYNISDLKSLQSNTERAKSKLSHLNKNLLQLHNVLVGNHRSLDELFNNVLKTGIDVFSLPIGIISEIVNDKYTVKFVVSEDPDFKKDAVYSLADTYCSAVCIARKTIFYTNVGSIKDLRLHPVYKNKGLESYIGTPIFVNNEIYGTLNFSSPEKTRQGFNQNEKEYIELMAKAIGNEIEKDIYRQELQNRTKKFEESNKELAKVYHENKTIVEVVPEMILRISRKGLIKEIISSDSSNSVFLRDFEQHLGKKIDTIFCDRTISEKFACQTEGLDSFSLDASIDFSDRPEHFSLEFIHLNNNECLVFIANITARKNRERDIRRLSLVASKTHNSISIADKFGKIIWVNESFTELTGYSLDEIIGKKPGSMLQGKDTNMDTVYKISQLLSKNKSVDVEILNYHKSGKQYWIALTINPVFDDDGEIENFISIQTDITQQKKVQEELTIAKVKAEESQKAKEKFLANMSHEIRTPMNAILGMANMLKKTSLNEKQSKFVDLINRSGANLLVIINDILDLSKIEAGEVELNNTYFRLISVINEVIEVSRYKSEEKGIILNSVLEGDLEDIVVNGDRTRLFQILMNLVGNAIKFTDVGWINLSINKGIQEGNNVELHFRIEDTGIGIQKDQMDNIFLSFQQVSDSIEKKKGGTGLGLAIVKKLVELQGGNVFVESEFGKGSIFGFNLSFSIGNEDDVEETVKFEVIQTKNTLKGKKILLAEDMVFNKMVIENLAIEWGCQLDWVDNGQKVLRKLDKETYDLILMDIQMPVMGGEEATRLIRSKIKENYQNIPIIALTAHAIKGVEEQYKEAGMNDYISKPFNEYELLRKICSLLNIEVQVIKEDQINDQDEKEINLGYDLSSVKSMAGGNKDFVSKMIITFINQTNSSFNDIRSAIKAQNYDSVYKNFHKIKPSFELLGITKLFQQILEIEQAIKANNFDYVDKSVEPFIVKTNKVIEMLKLET
jgi:PAS domain S-box-containing protein